MSKLAWNRHVERGMDDRVTCFSILEHLHEDRPGLTATFTLVAFVSAAELKAQGPGGEPAVPPAAEEAPRPPDDLDDAELAGLPRGSRPQILTWQRAYELALVASRSKPTVRGGELDQGPRRELPSTRMADFARFRGGILRGTNGRRQRVERVPGPVRRLLRAPASPPIHRGSPETASSRSRSYLEVSRQLILGAASGLTQSQVDQVDSSLQLARHLRSGALSRDRDALDAFKVELGLSPQCARRHRPGAASRRSAPCPRTSIVGRRTRVGPWNSSPRSSRSSPRPGNS